MSYVTLKDLQRISSEPKVKIFIKRWNNSFNDTLGLYKNDIAKIKRPVIAIGTLKSWAYKSDEKAFTKFFTSLNKDVKILPFTNRMGNERLMGTVPHVWILYYDQYNDHLDISREIFFKTILPSLLVSNVKTKFIILNEQPYYHPGKNTNVSKITKHFAKIECKCNRCKCKSIKNIII